MPLITGQDERVIQGISLDAYQAPISEVLGAAFDQAIYDNPANQISRFMERSQAAPQEAQDITDPMTGAVIGQTTPNTPQMLDAETARSKIAEAGIKYTVPDTGISQPLLDLIIRDKREAMRREQILARAPGGAVSGSLQFATALGASLLDPINIASAFIPVAGPARVAAALERAGASTLARAAVRARVGALEGAVGQAMLEPLSALSASQDQIDYGMTDMLRNVAFGALMGSALHTSFGALRDRFSPAARPTMQADFEPTSAAAIVARMNPETHQAAMKAAVAQAATGRMVDVDALAKLDATALTEISRLPQLRDEVVAARETYDNFSAEARAGAEPDAARYAAVQDARIEAETKLRGELQKLPDEGFALRASTRDGRAVMLNASAQQPGQWQLTRFAKDGTPSGDTQYPTKAQAVKDFLDEADPRTVDDMDGTFSRAPRGMADAQPAPRDMSGVRAASDRSLKPESSRSADMRAAAEAEDQLTEAPKTYDIEAAQKELTDVMNDLKATADQLGVEPGLKAFDDQLARVSQYQKALEAAAVCGARG